MKVTFKVYFTSFKNNCDFNTETFYRRKQNIKTLYSEFS